MLDAVNPAKGTAAASSKEALQVCVLTNDHPHCVVRICTKTVVSGRANFLTNLPIFTAEPILQFRQRYPILK